jgi:hypothetical protein
MVYAFARRFRHANWHEDVVCNNEVITYGVLANRAIKIVTTLFVWRIPFSFGSFLLQEIMVLNGRTVYVPFI